MLWRYLVGVEAATFEGQVLSAKGRFKIHNMKIGVFEENDQRERRKR